MQIAMFLTLGLLVFPSRLAQLAVSGLIVAAFLLLVARPLSVAVSLAFSRFSSREQAFISWVGLRGAAPIILATFPLVAEVDGGERIFNIAEAFRVLRPGRPVRGLRRPLPGRHERRAR